ncbi:MAG: hypothetical protein MAG451_03036 [Anaerolineales bacterium]|nr:hypothetical protein [Anaerolineales bacterium]
MAEDTERGGNYFALGAIVGAALGAAMALLFAPQRGDETRATLKEKGIELQQQARKAMPETIELDIEDVPEDTAAPAEKMAEELQQEPEQEETA